MFPAFAMLRARAQRVQCTSNLRNLYLATDLFVQRNGNWPQIRMQSESDNAQRDYARALRSDAAELDLPDDAGAAW